MSPIAASRPSATVTFTPGIVISSFAAGSWPARPRNRSSSVRRCPSSVSCTASALSRITRSVSVNACCASHCRPTASNSSAWGQPSNRVFRTPRTEFFTATSRLPRNSGGPPVAAAPTSPRPASPPRARDRPAVDAPASVRRARRSGPGATITTAPALAVGGACACSRPLRILVWSAGSSPISDSRPRSLSPGPRRLRPLISWPTSLPKRAARPGPQRLAALRPGAAAPTLVAPRPTASAPSRAARCPSWCPDFPLDRVFIRTVASRQGLARAAV